MAFLPRLRNLFRRPDAAPEERRRAAPGPRHGDASREDALRAVLAEDPNDELAFAELAEVVRKHAAESVVVDDPLAAPADEVAKQRAADLAVWSLAEELAGHPRGWYPLIELGRLSVEDDPEGAVRRFATAAERDPSGQALARSIQVLRDAGLPGEALGLGVGHWRAREHVPEAGRQLVLAAIEADRPSEARLHLDALADYPDAGAVDALRAELAEAIATAESRRTGA